MDIQLLIDNTDCAAGTGATFDRIDPVTGAVASRAAAGDVADAVRAADAAAAAFPAWSKTTPAARRALLLKAADALEARMADFQALITAETGATAPWGGFNVMFAAGVIREAASMTTRIAGQVIPSNKPGTQPWPSASRRACRWASRRGMRLSSSGCAPSPCRLPAATP